MRRLVIGDIHGAYKAMKQALDRAGFDPDHDYLYTLGDIVDGYPDSLECIEYLMSLKNRSGVIGNHDIAFSECVHSGYASPVWLSDGGRVTFSSYLHSSLDKDAIYRFFLSMQYVIVEDSFILVHGGPAGQSLGNLIKASKIDRAKSDPYEIRCPFVWDRTFFQSVFAKNGPDSKEDYGGRWIFIGHTPVQNLSRTIMHPLIDDERRAVAMDTGCGHGFMCTVMDIDTRRFRQSDMAMHLYPESTPR